MKETTPFFHLSSPPHMRHPEGVRTLMVWLILSLLPLWVLGIVQFGANAIVVVMVSIITAVLAETVVCKLFGKPNSIGDLSAVASGLLLGLSLPSTIAPWMAGLGALFGIVIAKMVFGGLGRNFINPALAGRVFLMISYPTAFIVQAVPRLGTIDGLDGSSGATPLSHLNALSQSGQVEPLVLQDALMHLFKGTTGGAIGELSFGLILFAGFVLWSRHFISMKIPLTFLGTLLFLSWIAGGGDLLSSDALTIALYKLMAGGAAFAAFFMANDPVTSSITPRGKFLFGTGCGILTWLFRSFGSWPEGAAFAVLIMNCTVPLIDHITRPRYLGEVRRHA